VRLPRPPDWLIYLSVAGLIVWVAFARQERSDAPPAPPPMVGQADVPLDPASPFDPARVVTAPELPQRRAGTAFSVSEAGIWLTARHVVQGCREVALQVAEGRAVAAEVNLDSQADLAVLITAGGAPALPIRAAGPLQIASRAYHPGFPAGRPGEVTSRYLGEETIPADRRKDAPQHVLAWAESGRTDELRGALFGLSGAPVLDGQGGVIGVTLSESPRRGRIYSTDTAAILGAMAQAGATPETQRPGEPVTTDNYGRVADALRRSLSVAQVVCAGRRL